MSSETSHPDFSCFSDYYVSETKLSGVEIQRLVVADLRWRRRGRWAWRPRRGRLSTASIRWMTSDDGSRHSTDQRPWPPRGPSRSRWTWTDYLDTHTRRPTRPFYWSSWLCQSPSFFCRHLLR